MGHHGPPRRVRTACSPPPHEHRDAIAAALAGCASTRVFIKTYEGPPLPENEAALLKPFLGVQVKAIDGDASKAVTPLRPGHPTNVDADISLKPGRHSILVGYFIMTGLVMSSSEHDALLEFEAAAGRRYVLRGEQGGDRWRPVIEDVTDNPARWCASAWECKSGPSRPIPPDRIR